MTEHPAGRAELTPDEWLALQELRQGNGLYYVAQEAAFAPGIAGEWPAVVKAPQSKHGRLVRRFWPVNVRSVGTPLKETPNDVR